jgi:copper chaperone CopZ
MGKVSLPVQNRFCEECSLALRRFIGNLDGIEAVDVGNGAIDITFDGSRISEERVLSLARDSVEKLGYRLQDDE